MVVREKVIVRVDNSGGDADGYGRLAYSHEETDHSQIVQKSEQNVKTP